MAIAFKNSENYTETQGKLYQVKLAWNKSTTTVHNVFIFQWFKVNFASKCHKCLDSFSPKK